ncbi:MAG: hypothetical protein D3924_18835, partial [Candidatus Electrothrix sp. AR4]|nr:hypothetical protein [Candidatus Electrothrix sp. AR4]
MVPTLTPDGISRFQAARRLRALGLVKDAGTPVCEVISGTGVHALVDAWRTSSYEDISAFWSGTFSADERQGHLDLVLCAVTQSHESLVLAIKQDSAIVEIEEEEWQWLAVNNVTALKERTSTDWKNLFEAGPSLLPPFTAPGTTEERIRAFLRHLRRFFDVANVIGSPDPAEATGVPTLERSSENLVDDLLQQYPGFTFEHWDDSDLNNALEAIFPNNYEMQSQFRGWLECIRSVIGLTAGIGPEILRFSVIEALWARGFLTPGDLDGLSAEGFQDALVGSVAYEFSKQIWNNADPGGVEPENTGIFTPVNPDGRLVNCIPPDHLSPLGPIAYLQELLKTSAELVCEKDIPIDKMDLGTLLAARRGPLGDLLASEANLSVPLPLIDIINEVLEYIAAPEDSIPRIIYNTAEDQVGGHELTTNKIPSADAFLHDPATLLEALPEHSTPNTPAERQGAWDNIKNDSFFQSLFDESSD